MSTQSHSLLSLSIQSHSWLSLCHVNKDEEELVEDREDKHKGIKTRSMTKKNKEEEIKRHVN